MAISRDIPVVETAVAPVNERESRQNILEQRLEDGYRRIDQAALSGADVTEWESFWVTLLGEYEDLCRDNDLAA